MNASSSAEQKRATTVMLGVCTSDDTPKIDRCMKALYSQRLQDLRLEGIVVVASECSNKALELLEEYSHKYANLKLLVEPVRKGKAHALNLVFNEFRERGADYLVALTGDSMLTDGAVSSIVKMCETCGAHIAGGSPSAYLDGTKGITRRVIQTQWKLHDLFLTFSFESGAPMHITDELMCISKKVRPTLPTTIINDGAYLAVTARKRGLKVAYCREAKVITSAPKNINNIILQRARIISGHKQIVNDFRGIPASLESSLLVSPRMGFSTIRAALREKGAMRGLAETAIVEAVAWMLSALLSRRTKAPWVWNRVQTN